MSLNDCSNEKVNPMKINICRLCGKRKTLQKRCHIIPKFLQTPVRTANPDRYAWRGDDTGNWQRNQDEWAKYWFCNTCDNDIFNKLGETPVAEQYSNGVLGDCDPRALDHLATSVLFRCGLVLVDAKQKSPNLLPAVRDWKRWLRSGKGHKCHPTRTLKANTQDDGSLAAGMHFYSFFANIEEIKGIELLWVNVPGIVFVGVLANKTTIPIDRVLTDKFFDEAFRKVNEKLAIREYERLPAQPPRGFRYSQTRL